MTKAILKSSILILFSALAFAYEPGELPQQAANVIPRELQGVGVTEHRGKKLNLDLQFQNSTGQTVKLGQYFNQGRPVVMAMVYYNCPNLCGMQMEGLANIFKKMKGDAGKLYELVLVSMDSRETPKIAAEHKAKVMKMLGKPGAEKHWHFLVGDQKNVTELASEIGFHYKWNEQLKQFAHATATYILTPEGVLSRYLYGVDYAPKTMRLSLVEAGEGKVGTIVDQITLCCFQFSPNGNKYVLWSFNLMRIACVFTVGVLSIILIPMWLNERKKKRRAGNNGPEIT